MEFLLLILVAVTLILLLTLKSNLSDQLRTLEIRLSELSRLLNEINLAQKKGERGPEVKPAEKSSQTIQHTVLPPIREAVKRPEETKTAETPPVQKDSPKEFSQQAPLVEKPQQFSRPITPVKKKPGFFESNPDLEKFIGENLANKIGIAILVVGIGFFVKYAIDREWINEIGRVFIGILCGGILLAVAHRLRKTFAAFSSVLVGGGIAVLYFTITIAFHEYHIFSQTAAFALMVVITGFTVLLSLGYNRVELAVLAILGGFGSPFMVSTGEGNYIVLFTYMLILNGGMLVLAYYKKWRIVNIVCYVFTIIIYAGWITSRFEDDSVSMIRGGLIFATLFYLIFFAMNIVSNLKLKTKFEAAEIIMLLSNTFLYFSAGMYLLDNSIGTDYRGLFTALLAIFNFVFAYSLYKNVNADRNLVFMLIGLVLTFISLAAPIQLEGNYITLFWAAETVILLWLWQKSGIKLMAIGSVLVMALMLISLAMDWKNIYLFPDYTNHLNVLLNKGYLTGVVSIASLILTLRLLGRERADSLFQRNGYKLAVVICLLAVLYIANLLELRYQVIYYMDSIAAQSIVVGTYNMFFIALMLLGAGKLPLPLRVSRALPALGFFSTASYLFYYHSFVVDSRNEYLSGSSGITGFLFHYFLVALLIVTVAVSLAQLNKNKDFVHAVRGAHWWIFIFLFVFVASAELDHTVLLTAYTNDESAYHLIGQNHKIGYPILWGISSFLLIAIGLNKQIKMLRIISLVLLLITLLKLFIFDLRNISEGGKIAAFISLGVLLLVVSFMYQRLKKLLLDDGQPDKHQTL